MEDEQPVFSWSAEKEDKLVELWQERCCLYAVSSPEYADRVAKTAALAEIAKELGTAGIGFKVLVFFFSGLYLYSVLVINN